MLKLPHGLFWKYAAWMCLVVGSAVLVSGSVQAFLKYRETSTAVALLHTLESHRAAAKINPFVTQVIDDLRATLSLLETGHVRSHQDFKLEAHRLLRQSSAIAEIRYIDAGGLEQIHMARFGLDEAMPTKDYSDSAVFLKTRPDAPYVGTVYFYKDSEPRTTVAVRAKRPDYGVMTVELNLKHVWQVIERIKVGRTGFAYVIDENGHLIAHPDIGLVLAKTDLSNLPHVRAALRATAGRDPRETALHESTDANGQPIVVTFARLDVPSWTVFIEQHRDEAYAPLAASLKWSGLLLAGTLLIGLIACVALARQVTRPVDALRAGAEIIGNGNLNYRIQPSSKDELGDLGVQFNRMAERLQDSYANLERKVADRTDALATANQLVQEQANELTVLNEQLNQKLVEVAAQKEEAERANAAKTRFLASASHDLRQPMHSIGLLVGLLDQHSHNPEVRDVVNKIRASVNAMEGLFCSLLDISKLDSDVVKPDQQEFEAGDLLRLIDSNYRPQAKEKGLEFRCVPSSAWVRSDPLLLERILGNLVANAIRYTERGKVLIGCRRHTGTLVVEVWDTGIGIPEAHLGDVFEEFFQLANPERDRDKGLGLGLSIVKRAAELLGHAVVVRSKTGIGSMFSVALPTVSRGQALPRGDTSRQLADSIRGAFVVVIDDESQSRFAMEASFKGWGCHVVSSCSAAEAITKLQGHLRSPDLIVSDYRLRGGSNGVQAIRDVRAIADIEIPGLIVTGDIAIAGINQAAKENLLVLHKPVGPEQLLRTSAHLLEIKSGQGVI